MSHTLKTKNVFITGGAQGLGKSYVDALLAAGAKVVFGDINPTVGAATQKEFVEKYGEDNVRFIQFDVTDGSKFEEAFQTAVTHLGHVDLMVNNAGILNESLWEKMIQIDYTGMVRGTLLAYDHMRKDRGGKGGRIINVSSELGLMDELNSPVYCGAKHAIRAFTSSLAMAPDVQQIGIEYGVLCPGPAHTDLIHKLDDSRVRHFNTVTPEVVQTFLSSIEVIQSGFMKLALLEEMNGAILLVNRDGETFCKMENVKLGKMWPLQEQSSESVPGWRNHPSINPGPHS